MKEKKDGKERRNEKKKANLRGINRQNETAQSHEDEEEEKTKRRRERIGRCRPSERRWR